MLQIPSTYTEEHSNASTSGPLRGKFENFNFFAVGFELWEFESALPLFPFAMYCVVSEWLLDANGSVLARRALHLHIVITTLSRDPITVTVGRQISSLLSNTCW